MAYKDEYQIYHYYGFLMMGGQPYEFDSDKSFQIGTQLQVQDDNGNTNMMYITDYAINTFCEPFDEQEEQNIRANCTGGCYEDTNYVSPEELKQQMEDEKYYV